MNKKKMHVSGYKFLMLGNWFKYQVFILICITSILLIGDDTIAQKLPLDAMRGPPAPVKTVSKEAYGSGTNFLLDIYQNYLSPVKGGNRCPMYPSCSQYAKILFEERPVYQAYIGTFERILRCGHELHLYPRITINNRALWYDPPPIEKKGEDVLKSVREELKSAHSYPLDHHSSDLYFDSTGSSFADYLFNQKEYYRAITEYMRLVFHSSDSMKKAEYYSRIGMCYYFGQDYDSYISWIEENRETFRKYDSLSAKMDLMLSKTYYHMKNYRKSISTIEWSNIQEGNLLYDESQFSMGVAFARIYEWEKASNCFSQINPKSPRGSQIGSLSNSIRSGTFLPSREPLLAGVFSAVIPGAGYVYSGRTLTGITSFIVNGVLIWSVTDAIKHRSYGIASALGFFGVGWYLGNISGSVSSAHQYNETVRNDFIEKLLGDIDIEVSEENLLKN